MVSGYRGSYGVGAPKTKVFHFFVLRFLRDVPVEFGTFFVPLDLRGDGSVNFFERFAFFILGDCGAQNAPVGELVKPGVGSEDVELLHRHGLFSTGLLRKVGALVDPVRWWV